MTSPLPALRLNLIWPSDVLLSSNFPAMGTLPGSAALVAEAAVPPSKAHGGPASTCQPGAKCARLVRFDSAMHVDVVIVGAGLSGIGAAVHLKKAVPHKSYVILEAREASGGTWDLFRYPGIRSDSDMYTLGYSFRPWPGAKAIADGPSILEYIRDTARDEGVDKHIQYDSRVVRAEWSTPDAEWTVTVQHS